MICWLGKLKYLLGITSEHKHPNAIDKGQLSRYLPCIFNLYASKTKFKSLDWKPYGFYMYAQKAWQAMIQKVLDKALKFNL